MREVRPKDFIHPYKQRLENDPGDPDLSREDEGWQDEEEEKDGDTKTPA